MNEAQELERLQIAYSDRTRRYAKSDRYSLFNRPHLFAVQLRQRHVLNLLRASGYYPLNNRLILEMGCGDGGILQEYASFGAKHLYGCDILFDQLKDALLCVPQAYLSCANGEYLPYPANTFDLVLQYTAFSSILDKTIKKQMAADMLRVLKQEGMIIWYDFWLNPTNPQTQGIRPAEIEELFPSCNFKFSRVTLAPPVARRAVSVSWTLSELLEKLIIFNSHYLVAIQPD